MIERVHEHLLNELSTNTKTDTVFVLASIALNLITLGINSGVSSGRNNGDNTATIVMFTFVALLIVVNVVAEIGLIRGRQTRVKLLNGLLKMYQDQGVAGYYDPSLLGDYRVRYNLFMLVVLFTGLIGMIIPFIIR
ncbi:MAG: hypothetical protein PHR56_06315 [Dehalococcoidales bacterium]|nr:hypothetical protein [Dehalococcoidales bacterium]